MDVVTTDRLIAIFMQKSLRCLNHQVQNPQRYSIKLQRLLYELKQSWRMWYNHLSEYLLKERYVNNPICPYVFIKETTSGFIIIDDYVDNLNIIGTHKEILEVMTYLKNEFETKDLGEIKYCISLQIEHLQSEIFLHKSNYIDKVLKHFSMDKKIL